MPKRQTFGDRMAVLKNARHELFAQAVASGETADNAYKQAGYKANSGNARTLKGKQAVSDRIATIQAKVAALSEFTSADAVRQADEDRAFAREMSQPSAAVSASTLKFKLLGLLVDKVQAEVIGSDVSDKPTGPHKDNVLAWKASVGSSELQ